MKMTPFAAILLGLALCLSTISLTSSAAPLSELVEAATRGDAEAQFRLGKRLSTSKKRSDKENALEWFVQSADQGHARAAIHAAAMFERGFGQKKKMTKAVKRYLEAADRGDAEVQFRLGKLLSASEDLSDKKKALRWFIKSADQGHGKAAFHAGVMFERGFGEKRNMKKAIRRYREAADAGNAEAMFTLATKYEEGAPSLKIDRTKARKSYEKAVSKWEKNGPTSEAILRH